jgi:hypothetical protein
MNAKQVIKPVHPKSRSFRTPDLRQQLLFREKDFFYLPSGGHIDGNPFPQSHIKRLILEDRHYPEAQNGIETLTDRKSLTASGKSFRI